MPEQTDFTTQLARLAPEIDEAAARELFERHRQHSGSPRWLLPAAVVVLIVAGVVGLVMVTGDEADAPATPADTTLPDQSDVSLRPEPGETLVAGEEHFDVIIVEQTTVGFGNAELVGATDELTALWAEWNPGLEHPAVDFASKVALVMTRPDNACADVVTRFEVTDQDGVSVWIPVFEELADACEDPLLSWLHVVAIDRAALGDRADIVVPAAELYDVPEQTIMYTAPSGAPDEPFGPTNVTLTPTDVVVPLPPVGEPALHNTGAGMFYVVNHGDGAVSVVPAVTDRRTTEDEGVTMLRSFVVPSESGESFFSDGDIWDASGRAATAGRSTDLVGYAGRVVGDEVEILYSDATRIEGDPDVPEGEEYPLPARPPFEAITPEQFIALSSSGPVWRLFDAELVVEDGVGRICQIDTSVSFDEREGCDETTIVIDTQVTSTDPDITTWYEAPILAFQDPVRGFTNVIPLAGYSSRNDAAAGPSDLDVTGIAIECGGPNEAVLLLTVTFDLSEPSLRVVTVIDGLDEVIGRSGLESNGESTVAVQLTTQPSESAQVRVESGDGQSAEFPVPSERPTCRTDAPEVADLQPFAIGDSVMLGATEELAARAFRSDVVASRQFADVIPTVQELVDAGQADVVPVVVHLGTNGPIEAAELAALILTMRDEGPLYLLTIHANRPWTEANNELIRAAGDRPNVTVIDWAEMAEQCPGECFAADGIHLAEAGREYYADLIAQETGR